MNRLRGETIICDYTNYKGQTSERIIMVLDYYYGSTHWHKERQELVVGYDIVHSKFRIFALDDMENIVKIQHKEELLSIATNWYEVKDDGKAVFNHQVEEYQEGKKPLIINDQYGLQSRWQSMNWQKEYVYYFGGKRLGNRKVD